MTVIVNLTDADFSAAAAYSERVKQAIRDYGRSYTGLETTDRYYIGRLGEIGLRYWLEGNFIRFEETMNDAGKSDKQDFVVWHVDGRRVRVNIKCSGSRRADSLMRPVAQEIRHGDQDLYVAAQLRGRELLLHGAVTVHDWRRLRRQKMIRVDTWVLPYRRLPLDMEYLRTRLQKVDFAESVG